jgi:MoaA/NifB/PqqE/SkfB family radical SAM enzyme
MFSVYKLVLTVQKRRTLRNHKKAYQNAVRAIKLFTESNYYTVVAPVVTRMNINEIDYVLETAIQLGASAFKPSIFMPSGRGMNHIQDLYLPKGDIKGLMAKLATKKEEYKADIDIQIDAMYPETESNCGKNEGLDNANEAVGCSAGNTQVVFTATGTVVACPFLYDFVAGDLRRESLRSIWHNSSVLMKFRNL